MFERAAEALEAQRRGSGVVGSGIGICGPFSPFGRRLRAVICWPHVAAASRSAAGQALGVELHDGRDAVLDERRRRCGRAPPPRGAWTRQLAHAVVARLAQVLVAREHLQVPEAEEDDRRTARRRCTPRTATRSASCGVIGGTRPAAAVDRAHARLQRRQAAGRVGAAPAAARVVGQRGRQPAADDRVDERREISALSRIVARISRTSRKLTGASTPSRNSISE